MNFIIYRKLEGIAEHPGVLPDHIDIGKRKCGLCSSPFKVYYYIRDKYGHIRFCETCTNQVIHNYSILNNRLVDAVTNINKYPMDLLDPITIGILELEMEMIKENTLNHSSHSENHAENH